MLSLDQVSCCKIQFLWKNHIFAKSPSYNSSLTTGYPISHQSTTTFTTNFICLEYLQPLFESLRTIFLEQTPATKVLGMFLKILTTWRFCIWSVLWKYRNIWCLEDILLIWDKLVDDHICIINLPLLTQFHSKFLPHIGPLHHLWQRQPYLHMFWGLPSQRLNHFCMLSFFDTKSVGDILIPLVDVSLLVNVSVKV